VWHEISSIARLILIHNGNRVIQIHVLETLSHRLVMWYHQVRCHQKYHNVIKGDRLAVVTWKMVNLTPCGSVGDGTRTVSHMVMSYVTWHGKLFHSSEVHSIHDVDLLWYGIPLGTVLVISDFIFVNIYTLNIHNEISIPGIADQLLVLQSYWLAKDETWRPVIDVSHGLACSN
jgi:hypothetical protein